MMQSGRVVHRQVELGDKAFEATCLLSQDNGHTYIMRYTDQKMGAPAFADMRLSRLLGKKIQVKANAVMVVPGYPFPMLSLSPKEPIIELVK